MLVINVSNLCKGSGVQIGVWFISKYLASNPSELPYLLLSESIYQELSPTLNLLKYKNYSIIDKSPVRNKQSRNKIYELEEKYCFSKVFTLFGPSGVDFKCLEYSGLANAWVTCASIKLHLKVFGVFGLVQKVKHFYLGRLMAKKDKLCFETVTSRKNFCDNYGFEVDNTFIIPNSVNDSFLKEEAKFSVDFQEFRILMVSAYYKHKNIRFLPFYAQAIQDEYPELNIKFVLTLSDGDFDAVVLSASKLGVAHYFENAGYVSGNKLPDLYRQASLVISPSELENFSACYIEAIKSKRLLAVSDRDFAHEICSDQAYYFEPSDALSFLNVIKSIFRRDSKFYYLKSFYDESYNKLNIISPDEKFNMMVDFMLNNES